MKKIKVFTLISAFMLLLAGCKHAESKDYMIVYSFSGESQEISVQNGVIVLSSEKDAFYGGNLSVSDSFPTEIKAIDSTFYIISDGQKETISSSSEIDMTEEYININGKTDLGKRWGDSGVLTNKPEETAEDIENNLYFELVAIDKNGEKSVYELKLNVTEVVKQIKGNIK